MKMKKLVSLLLAASMVAGLTACGGNPSPAPSQGAVSSENPGGAVTPTDVKTIRVSTNNPDTNSTTMAMQYFADLVMEKSNGSLKVEVYPNAQLGTEDNVFQQLMTGTLDMAVVSPSAIGNVAKEAMIFSFPFLIDGYDTYFALTANEEFREKLFTAVQDQTGCVALGFTCGAPRGVGNTKKEIRTTDDLKGMKIRTLGSPITIDTFTAFGATATSIPFKEVYTGLSQNLIDGEDSTVVAQLDMKFIEVNNYFTELYTVFQNMLLLCSGFTWETLTPEQQDIILECAMEAQKMANELGLAEVESSHERAAEVRADFKITDDLTAEERATFVDAAMPVWEKYKDEVGAEFFEFTYELIQEIQAG